jgi:beta-N-acetylhexosaminidase
MADELGCFIIDLEGRAITALEREMVMHPLVGGVILFTRNYESRAQLQHLCREIRAVRQRPLLIMVDQEGGRVQRFIHEFTRLPNMGLFGKIIDENQEIACDMAKHVAWLMAVELLSVGVDLSLAPVLDLNKGKNSVIGDRAYHSDPDKVIQLAQAFMQGMREAGMAATGKHFPGHGAVCADSHLAMPFDHRTLDEIENDDLRPFVASIKAGLNAMMTAHIVFPEIDSLPVGYSHIWLQAILRKRLGFKGAIISDDLNMEGANISANYTDRVQAAREAGCDFTLLCNNQAGVIDVLDHLPVSSHKVSKEKWGVLQGALSLTKPYQETMRWQQARELLKGVQENYTN